MAVFPSLGRTGNTHKVGVRRLRRRYDDGTQRSYARSTAKHRELTLVFKGESQARRDAIQAFVEARLVDNATFTIYDPQETQTLDLTGAAATGRHTCDEILNDSIEWVMSGKCRYDTEISFYLTD